MEVLIDCDILRNQKTGVEVYTYNIVKYLPNDLDLTLLHNNDINDYCFKGRKQIVTNRIKFPLSRFIYSILLPFRTELDIVHLPTPTAPFWKKPKGLKLIVTVHDLTPLKFGEYHNLRRKIYFRFIVKHLLNQADFIIADSESTKDDLIKCLGFKKDKIKVVYLATDINYTNQSLPVKYNISGDYILYIGTVEPRKNLMRLIEAYSKLKPKEKLVIVGASGWGKKDVYKNKNKNIIFTGYVPDVDIPKFYSNAKIFIYPSLYEGFGIPILEAMKCKCPVITSNISSMPEVAGDAALLINPKDTNDIMQAMKRLLSDRKLRESLVAKGINQVAKFSWNKCAKGTLKIYEDCLK